MSFPRHEKYKASGVAWLGNVPAHWDAMPIKRLASLQSGEAITAASIEEEGAFPVYGGNGLRGYATAFTHEGEYALIGRQGALCGNVNYATGQFWASEHAVVVSPTRPVSTKWLGEVLRVMNLNQYSTSAAQPGLSADMVSRLAIPVPPLPEQHSIAAFLLDETAKIDGLVEEQRRLIELLKEKRQVVISQAVTKGLNPNVPMKDSGVEWLGQVPAHWEFKALKRAIAPDTSISYGIVQPGEPLEEGVPFVQTTNMTTGDFNIENLQLTSSEIASAYPRSRLIGGEVLLGIRASIGACHVAPAHLAGCNLSRGVARIVCGDALQSEFLACYLSAAPVARYWQLAKQGSTFNEVSIETVRELLVVVPPLDEQGLIEMAVATLRTQLGALVTEAEAAVSLLKERRAALISAAVTGKFDVRGLVAQPKAVAA